jgi:diguanylate cyclase (GGDEF)-like protein
MTAITYNWLRYVMAFEQIPNRNDKKVEITLILPFAVSIVALVATYLVSPGLLIDENMKTTGMFDAFLVVVPYLYLIVMIIYAVRKSRQEDSLLEKKRHLYVGFIPVITVIGGLLQMILMPALPIFCFASTLLMLAFFIQSIEAQVSTDPLTKLNNRGQLVRYASQESNLWMEGHRTFIIMMDINDFKKINDTYGHAEGDKALVILSRTLTNVIRKCSYPIFLGRYGGDEFILIVHPANEEDLNELLTRIRTKVREQCLDQNKPYILSVGIGYDEVQKEEPDAFAKSLKRADEKMYQDKERVKQRETAEANH